MSAAARLLSAAVLRTHSTPLAAAMHPSSLLPRGAPATAQQMATALHTLHSITQPCTLRTAPQTLTQPRSSSTPLTFCSFACPVLHILTAFLPSGWPKSQVAMAEMGTCVV